MWLKKERKIVAGNRGTFKAEAGNQGGSLGLEHLKHSEDPKGNCLGAKLAGKSVSWGQVTWAPLKVMEEGDFMSSALRNKSKEY